jgi:DNA-binding NarL/FixJ family response regulator
MVEQLTAEAKALCDTYRVIGEERAMERLARAGRESAAVLRLVLGFAPPALAQHTLDAARASPDPEARAIAARRARDAAALRAIGAEDVLSPGTRLEVVDGLLELGLVEALVPLIAKIPTDRYAIVAERFARLPPRPEVSAALVRMLTAREPQIIEAVTNALARSEIAPRLRRSARR